MSTAHTELDNLRPCLHEEADSRIILHAFDAHLKGYNRVMIRTSDTDVLVLAVAHYNDLGFDQVWLAFGTRTHYRYIAVHEIATTLMPLKSRALLGFHAITGSDCTSAFQGKGKKTAWDTWNAFEEATEAFVEMTSNGSLSKESEQAPERFVILMYDRTISCVDINLSRKELFTKKGRSMENIPPTKDALVLHIRRSELQAKV